MIEVLAFEGKDGEVSHFTMCEKVLFHVSQCVCARIMRSAKPSGALARQLTLMSSCKLL